MKYILYILYRYYNNGENQIVAYVQSILIVLSLIIFNIFTILIAVDKTETLAIFDTNRPTRYLLVLLLLILPGFLLIYLIAKPKDLEDPKLKLNYRKIYGYLFILYSIISFTAFVVLTLIKHK